MKKVLVFLSALFILVGTAGLASAVPMTWTDTKDFIPDVLVPPTYSYYHDLGNDGFDTTTDFVTDYTLTIDVYDDSRYDTWEWVAAWNPTLNIQTYAFTMGSLEFGWSLGGLLDINHDGTLNVAIQSWHGDFYLDSSTLTANGDAAAAAPVPEPATMILMGLGLVGLAGASRKKLFKK